MKHLFLAALAVPAAMAGVVPKPLLPRAPNPPQALPQNATIRDLTWQPSLDFDTDGCYNVPAIDAQGNIVQGLPNHFTGLASDCRDASDLDNNNVYSRQRCNNNWCAYLYDYYFEKDVAVPYVLDTGHKHDWEHIVVWTEIVDGGENEVARWVAVSQHGDYEIKKASDIRWDGSHPKIVYHKDGWTTHCFRFANAADDKIENHKGVWFRGALVSYNGFPSTAIRDKLISHDFGKANIAFKDAVFADHLNKAKPKEITNFNTGWDDPSMGSPGWP
ncbi:hypothetical protein VTJ49DRAFT_5651 [Mycothermus thermophilus]|uniref:Uncharacterized protein n=1 Tax=Humicola insolens TaxID=85995 RepID=A0ABR3VMZ5_HUMIN